MKTNQNKQIQSEFLSPKTLADRWEVSVETLKRWRRAGKLHPVNFGRSVRFPVSEILKLESEGFKEV